MEQSLIRHSILLHDLHGLHAWFQNDVYVLRHYATACKFPTHLSTVHIQLTPSTNTQNSNAPVLRVEVLLGGAMLAAPVSYLFLCVCVCVLVLVSAPTQQHLMLSLRSADLNLPAEQLLIHRDERRETDTKWC